MNTAISNGERICKSPWNVSHKESPDGNRMDIIVRPFEKLEVVVMSIPMFKALPTTITSVEEKVTEALLLIQTDSCNDSSYQLQLRICINENTGEQEVYIAGNNSFHQLVVSTSDFEE